jgi:hypothetical protein
MLVITLHVQAADKAQRPISLAQALQRALAANPRLTSAQRDVGIALLHVATGHESGSSLLPHVRHALALWKLMTDDATERNPQAAIEAKLGIRVVKVSLDPQDPVHGIQCFLDGHPTKLIVLATHGRDGLPRWAAAMAP